MRLITTGLAGALILTAAPVLAAGGEVHETAPFHPFVYGGLAAMSLVLIIYTSLFIEKLASKAFIFLALGAGTIGLLWTTGGAEGVLRHVYLQDYPQFIGIPLVTVLIASMGLLAMKVSDDFKPGWFMVITVPIIGNFATTWALVPIAVSLYPVIKNRYPNSYWTKLIITFIFGGNILALGTVLADPPQAYWAVQLANAGTPMAFFYTGSQFWLFMAITWLLYGFALWYFGVEFGRLSVKALIPPFESYLKLAGAAALCIAIGFALLNLEGYNITMFLGGVFVTGFIVAAFMNEHVRHDTIHWCVETATIFIAFFAVVAFMHVMLENVDVTNEVMVLAVMGLTWMADNAAAFAAGYPKFAGNEEIMLWYNLFPSVTQGSLSPLGNGPQIVTFLVIFTAAGHIRASQVFREWFKVCGVFAPYLFIWTFGSMIAVKSGFGMTWYVQLFIGIIAGTAMVSIMAHVDRALEEQKAPPHKVDTGENPATTGTVIQAAE